MREPSDSGGTGNRPISSPLFFRCFSISTAIQLPAPRGLPEAAAIDRRVKKIPTPRPLTHDLLANVIRELDGELEKVVIHDLRNHTFYAKLVIRRDGQLMEVDSRPSDAIALIAATDTPIYVEESVLRQVCDSPKA